MENKILVFVHIPKTGGVSLYHYLASHFNEDQIAVYTPIIPNHDKIDIIQQCNHSESQIRFIAGHLPYGIHQFLNQPCEYITFLRHPIDQLLSMYSFIRYSENMPLYEELNQISFQNFLKQPEWDSINNNPQARMLCLTQNYGHLNCDVHQESANWWTPGSTYRYPERVKQFLRDQIRFIGITEHMTASVKALSGLFNWPVPKHIPHENKTYRRTYRDQLSPDVIALIRHRCSLDMELYEYALQLFRERTGTP